MREFRSPILVNAYEKAVDAQLAGMCKANDCQLLPKVRVADVLPVEQADLSREDFTYALKAHFDFVVVGEDNLAKLAVEFDGGHHATDPRAIANDARKDRICKQYFFPLLRVEGSDLRRTDHRTLLQWFLDVWFEHRRLAKQWELYYETDGDTDKPEVELDDFRYQSYGRVDEDGRTLIAPMDPFSEARKTIGLRMIEFNTGSFDGWHGTDARGKKVGHVALEVEKGQWLMGSGTVNLAQFWVWTGLYPTSVAQDIAMLSLAGQIEEWQRGRVATVSQAQVERVVAGCDKQLLSCFETPDKYEHARAVIRQLGKMGADTSDPKVFLKVYSRMLDDDDPLAQSWDDDDW